MGQVPERASYLLVGDGRLAAHLSHYFQAKHLDLHRWSRRQGVIGADAERSLDELIAAADRVLLAIRDDALTGFVARHRRGSDAIWVHFSGSLVLDSENEADEVWSAHPLCTFSGEPYDLATYETIPFVVEREGPSFAELLPGLDNPSAAIPGRDKALYHALCVSAGNFTQLLWQQLFTAFEHRLCLAPELALPYLRQTALNLEQAGRGGQAGGDGVLTGPLARRDGRTIERNLAALDEARLPGLVKIYRAFLDLAGETAETPTHRIADLEVA